MSEISYDMLYLGTGSLPDAAKEKGRLIAGLSVLRIPYAVAGIRPFRLEATSDPRRMPSPQRRTSGFQISWITSFHQGCSSLHFSELGR